MVSNNEKPVLINVRENLVCEDLVKQLSKIPTENFLKKDGLVIQTGNVKQTLDGLAVKVIN